MRWTVHSERSLYTDPWLDIRIADVELPDGRHLDHRLIRTLPGAGAVVVEDRRVLLLWRHRFITGSCDASPAAADRADVWDLRFGASHLPRRGRHLHRATGR